MQGNKAILDKLNFLLADELTAISQYMVHAEMCDNWGYKELAKTVEKRAIDEMKHAEKHIARILFLAGTPVVSELNKMHIGDDVEAQLTHDWEAENGTIKAYNDAIKLAGELGDNGTSDMFSDILKEEEAHIDWIETQLDQIKQMGIQVYLSKQVS